MIMTPQRVEFALFNIGDKFAHSGCFWQKIKSDEARLLHAPESRNTYGILTVGIVNKFCLHDLCNIVLTKDIVELLDSSTVAMYNNHKSANTDNE